MCPGDDIIGKLPDHLLIDIMIRVPSSQWVGLCCVNKHWAQLFRHDTFWQTALLRNFPDSATAAIAFTTWPRPPLHFTQRRYAALYISKNLICINEEELDDEMLGHAYLFLKDQLQLPTMPLPAGILHHTLIDQFISCGKSWDKAHELASQIWVAVLDNLEENQQTFILLKRLALEGDVFLAYPYSKCIEVEWRVFEKLFTDFRDCFNREDYYDILACAKHKFQPLPPLWLGF